MPLFVAPEPLANEALPAMARFDLDGLVREVDELAAPGSARSCSSASRAEKDEEATGAWEDDGIVQQALRALRPRFPELVLLTDVCLCEYTSHGHCGVVVDGEVAQRPQPRAARAHRASATRRRAPTSSRRAT